MTQKPLDGLDSIEQGTVARLARIVDGKFDIGIPESVVRRESMIIARHVYDLIKREVEWVERKRHPWRKEA